MADQSTRIVLQADDKTRAAFESAKAGITGLQSSATALSGVLAAATASLAGLTVVAKFQSFVEGAAALDDLAEKTGASVEKLSALSAVAKVSGTSLETVEGGLIKFAKALNGADNESQKASQAFAALGLDPGKLRTKDTAEAFKVLADRLFEFRDDSSKTAAVLEILGKSGAQLLPYLKDLAETGDLQGRVTAEQAAQAENLEKNLNRLFATKNAGFREFSAAVLPTVDAFVKALLDAANGSDGLRKQIKALTADGTINDWAQNVAIGFAWVIDGAMGVKNTVEILGRSLAVMTLQAEYGFGRIQRFFDTRTPPKIKEIQEQTARANLDVILNSAQEDLNAILNRTQFRDKVRAQFAQQDAQGSIKPETKESLNFQVKGKEKLDKFKDELRIVDAFVDSIGQRLIGQTEGEFEMLRQRAIDVFGKVDFNQLSGKDQDRFLEKLDRVNAIIDQLDERAAAAGWAKALADSFKLVGDAADRADEAFAKFNEAQSQQAQDLQFELSIVGKLASERQKLTAIRKIDLDAQRAVASIPENAPNRDERIADVLSSATAAKASVGALSDEIRTKGRDAWLGLSSASREYFDRVTNDAENMRSLLGNAFKGLEDTFVQFTLTGKLSFKNMVDSIAADLVRIQVRNSITAPLSNALGGLFGGNSGPEQLSGPVDNTGGFFGGLRNLLGFATGGRPPVGVPSMVGERGPELFIPDVSGTIVPNSSLGGGVSLTQNISIDSRSDRSTILAAMAQAKEMAKSEIADMLTRNGQSGMARAMA